MRGQRTDDNTRAQVIAALLVGQGMNEVAATSHLPKQTVSDLAKTIDSATLGQVRTKKMGDFGALIAVYLEENLTTLTVQAVFFRTEEWLKSQEAAELATLHGVLADKALRLLEAAELAQEALNDNERSVG